MRVKRDMAFPLFDLLREGLPLEQAAARIGISYSKAHGIATSETWQKEYDAEIRKLLKKIKDAYGK